METNFNFTKDQYLLAKQLWANTKYHSAADHILYNIIRNRPAQHGFIAKSKSIQGNDPWFAYNRAFQQARMIITYNPAAFKAKFGFDMPSNMLALLIK